MGSSTTSGLVRSKVNSVKAGQLIDYKSLGFAPDQMEAVAQALSRLYRQGEITRLSKGVYYKPQKTPFGFLQPSESTILKRYLKDGYITGVGAYNQLGLTTQTPYVVNIATEKRKSPVTVGGLKIKFITSNGKINVKTKPILPIIDAIKNIKRIPDADINTSLQVLKDKVKKMNEDQCNVFAKAAMDYNAATRAVAGALLESTKEMKSISLELKKSVNALTKFKLGVDDNVLPNKSNWNIV